MVYTEGTDAKGQPYGKGLIECSHIVHLKKYNKRTDEMAETEESDDKEASQRIAREAKELW